MINTQLHSILFDEVVNIINGKSQKNVFDDNGKYPIYGSGGIMGYANDFICEKDTVIIGRKGSINSPIYVEEPFWNVDTAFGLCAKKEKLDPKFLFYFCEQFNFEALNTTVTIPSLTKANLKKIKIPLPPLPIQEKIVQVLDKAQLLIDLREKQILHLDELVQSVFYEMFGDPVTNPKGWEVTKLVNVCNKITDGTHDTPIRLKEGVKFISGKHIRKNHIDFENSDYVSLSDHTEIYKRCNPEFGDVLYTNIGANLGTAAFNHIDFEFSMKNVALLKYNRDFLLGIFLERLLNTPIYLSRIKYLSSLGGAQSFLSLKDIKGLKLILPPVQLQLDFADKVQKIETQKVLMQKSLEEMKNNYNSLMQKAFKGELFRE